MKQRRGPYSKAVCQAAAILAHQCASGASGLTTVAPTDQTPGAVSLHGVVIYVPRTEWPDLEAGPDLLGVAVKSFLPKGTSERHWDVIFPLDADDQVFEFSESRLFHFLELHQTSLRLPHSPTSPLVPTPPISESTEVVEPLVLPTQPSPALEPRTAIVIYGLGAQRCHTADTIISLFRNFASSWLHLSRLENVTFQHLFFTRYPSHRRSPDVVVLELPESIRTVIWQSKTTLPRWLPVSIDVYRTPSDLCAHLGKRAELRSSSWLYPSRPMPSTPGWYFVPALSFLYPPTSLFRQAAPLCSARRPLWRQPTPRAQGDSSARGPQPPAGAHGAGLNVSSSIAELEEGEIAGLTDQLLSLAPQRRSLSRQQSLPSALGDSSAAGPQPPAGADGAGPSHAADRTAASTSRAAHSRAAPQLPLPSALGDSSAGGPQLPAGADGAGNPTSSLVPRQ